MKNKKAFFFVLSMCLLSFVFAFDSCSKDSSSGDDTSGTTSTTTTDPEGNTTTSTTTTTTEKQTTIWTGSTDFNDPNWSGNIQIGASNFSEVADGSQILIEYSNSTSATDYQKVKLTYMGSSWTELTGGNFTNCSYDNSNGGIDPASSPLTYTLTADNAAKLKQYGLAILGYGVVITKVDIKTGGASTGGDNSSENTTPSTTPDPEPATVTGTPYDTHGKLSVKGAYLYDSKGAKYQLYGMSTHGLNFGDDFSKYVNKAAFTDLRDVWNTNCIRLVLYPRDYNGYCNGGNQSALKQIVQNGVEYATSLGMYVIIDWHVHNYNPKETQSEAITFLTEMANKYANYGNVLYEICNEPTGSDWGAVLKTYAQAVIPEIRKYAPDAVVIVGTNTWSQDIEGPTNDPLSPSTYGNVMYTFHFYAQTHTSSFRTRVENAIKSGCPIFITEFGTCDASGNGGFNATESNNWFDLIAKYNISHFNWSLCNKGETASAIQSSCSKTSGWTTSDLTESGLLIYNHFRTLKR